MILYINTNYAINKKMSEIISQSLMIILLKLIILLIWDSLWRISKIQYYWKNKSAF